jgi:antiphage defense system Thoeris ThsB-like protein
MFTRKRGDTLASTIERQYGVNLNVRSDMLLGNLLEERGFDSLSQLLDAYRGRLTDHARRGRVFLSFHAEDRAQVEGFRLMVRNPRVALDMYDASLREPIDSDRSDYIKRVLREKIGWASVMVCLIGHGTAWREWVDWELNTALGMRKGICGARLKGSRGRTPEILREIGAPIATWEVDAIVAAIECAAARRSCVFRSS